MNQLQPVETLVVDIAIDNLSDNYSSKPSHISPEFNNVMAAGATEISGSTLCCAQLGLALVLTAVAGNQRHTLLFDAGPEGAIFLRNCRNLGVSLADVEAIAISHGHWDHMGALLDTLDHITRHNKGRQVPCHVNPGMFLERAATLTTGHIAPFQRVPSPEELSAHGAQLVNSSAPRFLLDDCFYVSGEIPRVSSFEKGRPDHLCRRSADEPWQPDPLIMDERYVAVHVRGKGVIVFSACSHAGIINVLLNAREVFPDVPLYGVLGGLHLAGAAMERLIPDTMAHLKQFELPANHASALHRLACPPCPVERVWRGEGHTIRRRQPIYVLMQGEMAQPPCLMMMRTHGVDGARITALEAIGARSADASHPMAGTWHTDRASAGSCPGPRTAGAGSPVWRRCPDRCRPTSGRRGPQRRRRRSSACHAQPSRRDP